MRRKLELRDRLLDLIACRGDEMVLDVGCGKGLLLAGRVEVRKGDVRELPFDGRLALIDFIFTGECVRVLREVGAGDAARSRIGGFQHWAGAILTFGAFQLYQVTATGGTLTALRSSSSR